MRFKRSLGLSGLVAAVTWLTSAAAFAQQTFDHPTFKGGNTRQGKNGDPSHNGPGRSNLRWWTPSGLNVSVAKPIIDNTDTNPAGTAPDGGPYELNPYGGTTLVGAWDGPLENEEASLPFLKPVRRVTIGGFGPNFNSRWPAYLYARCVPTLATPYDPRTPAVGTSLRTFTWRFNGVANEPKNYSVWVNLPVGPTRIGGGPHFPQRYFVYEIIYGPGANGRYVDVVDTYASGGGWIRLGGGGYPTDRVFPYDGTNPIRVRLFNTVPRDADGNLTMPTEGPAPGLGLDTYLVTADAVRFDPAPGGYDASPSSMRLVDGDPNSAVVTAANNELTVGRINGLLTTVLKGVVTNHTVNTSAQRWRYSPLEESGYPYVMDPTLASPAGQFAADPTVGHYSGANAFTADVTDDAANYSTVSYSPTTALGAETYDIYVYLPGSSGTTTLAQRVVYLVHADGQNYSYEVDQSQAKGWVRLGNRRFRNIPAVIGNTGDQIVVQATNYSSLGTDINKKAYADTIRFVGERNQRISSTPIHASALIRKKSGVTEETKVVIVADENGFLHCLDATGNPDGTTVEYWSYPSLRDRNNYDPNLGRPGVVGPDYGGPDATPAEERFPSAEMPQGFNLSSGLVQRIAGVDYLFIGSTNGRVYCIAMAGRGDYDSNDPVSTGYRLTGTTTRVWTYPNTYPSANSVSSSDLIRITGSVAYGEPNGLPTIYVPSDAGRIYALNAIPTADKSVVPRWTYPALTDTHLGPIAMTPTVAFNKVYFGTLRNPLPSGDVPGQFYALNWLTGQVEWSYQSNDDFLSSPAVATEQDLDPTSGITNRGLIYAINQNHTVLAFYSETGVDGGGNPAWFTDELSSGAEGSVSFAWQTVYNNAGVYQPYPIVLIPTSDGHIRGLFARTADVNKFGGRLASSFSTQSDSMRASLDIQGIAPTVNPAVDAGTGWMMAADSDGYLYAFNDQLGYLSQGQAPGNQDVVPNDRLGDLFRKAKVKLITRPQYQQLRLPTDGTPRNPTYAEAAAFGTNQLVFEWGQTAYIMVYNFPFLRETANDQIVDPPVVNVSFVVNGRTIRGIAVSARQFSQPLTAPIYNDADPTNDPLLPPLTTGDGGQGGDRPMDGYAILAFPFQNSGANSLPPGDGEIQISVSTAALNESNVQQNVLLNPNPNFSRYPFKIANPLALMVGPAGTVPDENYTGPVALNGTTAPRSMGLSNDPADPENLANGSFNVAGKNGSLIGAGTAITDHGASGKAVVYVIDRSMMALLRPDPKNQGLDNVRINRRGLLWQGGRAAVYKGVNDALGLVGFEDLPVNSPNTSFDYPDIHADRVSVTKEPLGGAENPLFNGVTLRPPLKADGVSEIDEDTDPKTRVFRATPFVVDIDIPRFQPPNNTPSAARIPSSDGGYNNQGYISRFDVFVDSVQNGRLDTVSREAYRSLNVSTAVNVDQRLGVTTPTVDLGSLPGGTGYEPGIVPGTGFTGTTTPWNVFSPWPKVDTSTGVIRNDSKYAGVFKSFGVQNEGNVNLLNVRVAKALNFGTPDILRVGGDSNDLFNWLDGTLDLWSDIDPSFGVNPSTGHPVFVVKARVQDRIPTELKSNPVRRENPGLGTTGKITIGSNVVDDVLNQSADANNNLVFQHGGKYTPVVGVSVPIGFPVGKYQQRVRVFEDWSAGGTSDGIWGNQNGGPSNGSPESFTDPGFLLSFTVGETRLTNSHSPLTATMFDNLSANNGYWNSNIQPTMARDAFGSLVTAFASNRPDWTSTVGSTDQGAYRLFFSTLDSGATFSTNSNNRFTTPTGSDSPLADLNVWRPISGDAWFRQVRNAFPRPNMDGGLFGLGTGETLLPGTVRYGTPSFPVMGGKDPYNPNNFFSGMFMGFSAQAQRRAADNTVRNDSRLMMSVVTTNQNGGMTISDPFVMTDAPDAIKGRPAVVQTGGGGSSSAIVFYPVTQAGASSILYTRFNSTTGFNRSQVLPFGTGFSSVSSPSATGRILGSGQTWQDTVIELTFQGKLRGRPYPEVFMGRLRARGANNALTTNPTQLIEDGSGNVDPNEVFSWFAPESNEGLQAESEAGLYRARGVFWNTQDPISLRQILNNVSTDLLIPNTGTYDQQTKLISYSTRLGGKVYLDPMLGTVRFSNGMPSRNARLLLTYTPRFLRVSAGGAAGYNDPTMLFDEHFITDPTFWRQANGNDANLNTVSAFTPSRPLTVDRTIFTYNRAAAGGGQGARPFIYTLRYGVRLDYRLPTTQDGRPGFVQGNNFRPAIAAIAFGDGLANDAFQVDPAQGRVYFPASNEGRTVTVSYYGVDNAGNVVLNAAGNPLLLTVTGTVSLIAENGEAPIPIETSVNETNLVPALDPFNYRNVSNVNGVTYRRPPLLWMIWSSTRNGSPDLYFQSIAPRWTPVPPGQ